MTDGPWFDERELLERAKFGDPEAHRHLVDLYAPMLFKYFRGLDLPIDIVEDLMNETFASFIDSIGRFRGDSSLKTFIYGIAHNMRCRYFSEKKRSLTALSRSFIEKFKGFYSRSAPGSPEDMLIAEEQKSLLAIALKSLPLDFKEILVLRFMEECSLEETAQILDLAVGTVKSRTHRAKAMLKEKIVRLEKTGSRQEHEQPHAPQEPEEPMAAKAVQRHLTPPYGEQPLTYPSQRAYRSEDRVTRT